MKSSFRRTSTNNSGDRQDTTATSAGSSSAEQASSRAQQARAQLPDGTKLSAHNGLVLISTGIPSLDDLLGGGLPLGTALLADEDRETGYATLMMQYYLAQGIQLGHHVLVASADDEPITLVKGSPAPALYAAHGSSTGAVSYSDPANSSDKMTIAWRYQNKPQYGASPGAVRSENEYCTQFDLSKQFAAIQLEESQERIHLADLRNEDEPFESLYQRIVRVLEVGNFLLSSPPPLGERRKALRIAVHAMCSPYWPGKKNEQHLFMHRLRSLLRRSCATAFITLSWTDAAPRPAYYALADFAISLDAFASSTVLPPAIRTNPFLTSQYTGLLYVHKVARLNALVPASVKLSAVYGVGMDRSLAFHARRKRFAIETWHLPPDIDNGGAGDETGKDGADAKARDANDAGRSCSSRGADF